MPYGFSAAIRNRYRKLWAKKQTGKGVMKSDNLKNQREPVKVIKKRKRKSKRSLKLQENR